MHRMYYLALCYADVQTQRANQHQFEPNGEEKNLINSI